ncbi:MAG: hypothetical protein OEZ41_06845 [Nitrospirota bacterium]|nr:hypothetical protein [Nitrospirota bacterium]
MARLVALIRPQSIEESGLQRTTRKSEQPMGFRRDRLPVGLQLEEGDHSDLF